MSSTGPFCLTKSPGTCSGHTIPVRLSRSDHLVKFRAASSGLVSEEVLSGTNREECGCMTVQTERAPKYSFLGDAGLATDSFFTISHYKPGGSILYKTSQDAASIWQEDHWSDRVKIALQKRDKPKLRPHKNGIPIVLRIFASSL